MERQHVVATAAHDATAAAPASPSAAKGIEKKINSE